MEWRELQAVWNGDISTIRPIGDFVLVRPFPREHGTGSLIIDPGTQMTKDGRWRTKNRLKGNQMGEVVAIGRGDVGIVYDCACGASFARIRSMAVKCDLCGGDQIKAHIGADQTIFTWRAPMNVHPGDIVIYPQVPANEVSINGEKFIFLHEESQVYGVVEEEVAA